LDLLTRGLHYIHLSNDEMTHVVGPISEVTDAMEVAQDVIDYVREHGYKD
jgi:hypothetical protein